MTAHRDYETTYILAPDIDPAERERIAERVRTIIEGQFGGTIKRVDDWGRRQLAYPINKVRYGIYVYQRYSSGPDTIAELERVLRLLDPVLKFLTVQIDADMASDARPDQPARAPVQTDDDEESDD
jgi:small subunit ribosomal protein S6